MIVWHDVIDPWLRERHPARGTVVFCLVGLLLLACLWGLQAYAQSRPDVLRLYVPEQLQRVQQSLVGVMLWLLVLAGLAWAWRDRNHRISRLMSYLCVTPVVWMLVVLWAGYGVLDTPMAMVTIASLVMARALFPLRVLMPGMVLGTLLVVADQAPTALGWRPIAPLLAAPVYSGEPMSWWWTVWLTVVLNVSVWPFIVGILYLFKSLAQRRAQLEHLASTDTLTGLFNRREFMGRLAQVSGRHEAGGQPLSLIMMDIDHFKRINDTFGHPAGDVVLERMGALLSAGVRPGDVAARLGGEEFAVLMPQTTLAEASAVAGQLSESLRQINFVFDG
ncbi:MAG TPA: diguanylate cyclase, partial [Aquabacterium sp.]|nr:diguanylate cyclase [Aquabacterium sp.]